jgi:hypothetical protein
VLVNSRFTASVFDETFSLIRTYVRPAVLYPAINLAKYDTELPKQRYALARGPQGHTRRPSILRLCVCRRRPQWVFPVCFLSINRFERKKNIELAVAAFAELQLSDPALFRQCQLIIAGVHASARGHTAAHTHCAALRCEQVDTTHSCAKTASTLTSSGRWRRCAWAGRPSGPTWAGRWSLRRPSPKTTGAYCWTAAAP